MTAVWEHPFYKEDIANICGSGAALYEGLRGATIAIAGAGGLIGSCLVDVLMGLNADCGMECTVVALGRNLSALTARFCGYGGNPALHLVAQDVCDPPCQTLERLGADFVVHLASNTHPVSYATDPIGTITANILGTRQLLDFCARHGARRFLYASSVEVYGENRGDAESFAEGYCGHIDCNTLRAGYPESKRCGEALCQAYRAQKDVPVVIPRFARTYGPTLRADDSKALSQFIARAVQGQDIVLTSGGTQRYSFCYVADAVSGLLHCLLCGKDGEAYNVASPESDITLRQLATLAADWAGTSVVTKEPPATEKRGYSTATKAMLDTAKLCGTGWKPRYAMQDGLFRTLQVLRDATGASDR